MSPSSEQLEQIINVIKIRLMELNLKMKNHLSESEFMEYNQLIKIITSVNLFDLVEPLIFKQCAFVLRYKLEFLNYIEERYGGLDLNEQIEYDYITKILEFLGLIDYIDTDFDFEHFVLDDIKIKQYADTLETEEFTGNLKNLEECSICLNEMKIPETCKNKNCNHYYHCNCIARWSDKSKTCPLCRTLLNLVKIKSNVLSFGKKKKLNHMLKLINKDIDFLKT